MMFNNFQGHGESEGRKRASEPNRKLGDREVPLSGIDAIRSRAVHAWLDGSAPERDVRQGEWARDVDFWKRLDEDLVHRRHMRTPVGLNARIMNAFPPTRRSSLRRGGSASSSSSRRAPHSFSCR